MRIDSRCSMIDAKIYCLNIPAYTVHLWIVYVQLKQTNLSSFETQDVQYYQNLISCSNEDLTQFLCHILCQDCSDWIKIVGEYILTTKAECTMIAWCLGNIYKASLQPFTQFPNFFITFARFVYSTKIVQDL